MNPVLVAFLTFASVFGGAGLGLFIQRHLPDHHLKPESKDSVKLIAALIATMAALVLGILVGAAKGSFDTVHKSITEGSANYIYLDRLLAFDGRESGSIRQELRANVQNILARLWPEELSGDQPMPEKTAAISGDMEKVLRELHALPAAGPEEALRRTEKLRIAHELLKYRWLVLEQSHSSMSVIFFIVLLFWLTALNTVYGLFAPFNGTVVTVLLISALSVAGALFLITEMSHPLEGFIKVPSTPFHKALEYMGQ